jgi:3'-phosphoadenosine 5'-phosphosulfate sulfotransferase (PAPS reductase)/FAD synthetase
MADARPVRHILSLSGGKDSAALALYMRDRVPDMEYVFNDTRKELPETYDYLNRIEDYLGKHINRLNADLGFDHWYDVYGGMIPSNGRRWCTRMLKLKPFEQFVGDDPVLNYVGLRADEARTGYISHKPNITPIYPFRDDGLKLADIQDILLSAGVGLPPYTEWGRTRSGCFFCFYQQKIEWVHLKEKHPNLYEEAKKYERPYEGNATFSHGPPERASPSLNSQSAWSRFAGSTRSAASAISSAAPTSRWSRCSSAASARKTRPTTPRAPSVRSERGGRCYLRRRTIGSTRPAA